MSEQSNYVAYEYKEIKVPESQSSLYLDCYESFGWKMDDRKPSPCGVLSMRRDRRLINRTELTRLQRHFEACMQEIERLEASKTSAATAAAMTVGVFGTAFIAGSVFAATAVSHMWWLCVLLAVPGFMGLGLAPLLYRQMTVKRSAMVEELIGAKYEEIYQLCEKAHSLL